jgi:hypothetical protein
MPQDRERNLTMPQDLYDKGVEARRAVLRADYVNQTPANTDDFNSDIQKLATEYCGAPAGDPPLFPNGARAF